MRCVWPIIAVQQRRRKVSFSFVTLSGAAAPPQSPSPIVQSMAASTLMSPTIAPNDVFMVDLTDGEDFTCSEIGFVEGDLGPLSCCQSPVHLECQDSSCLWCADTSLVFCAGLSCHQQVVSSFRGAQFPVVWSQVDFLPSGPRVDRRFSDCASISTNRFQTPSTGTATTPRFPPLFAPESQTRVH